MKKAQLLKMKKLYPTEFMIRKANMDIPQVIHSAYSKITYDKYKVYFYIRCCVQDNIMKVAIFKTANIRIGSKKPVCEIFLDKKNQDFTSYDFVHSKWTEAMLTNMKFLCSGYDFFHIRDSAVYSSKETNKRIKDYLGVSKGGIEGINEFQYKVRQQQLENKYRKETKPWDEKQELVPVLPKDWNKWLLKTVISNHFIFYEYKRNVKKGYCTHCQKEVLINTPKYNQKGKCSCCGVDITYKSIGKAGKIVTEEDIAYLLQKTTEGFIIREFRVFMKVSPNSYNSPQIICREYRRIFYDTSLKSRTFYFGDYKHREFRWIETYNIDYWWGTYCGHTYRRNLSSLKKLLQYTGLIEVLKSKTIINPEIYLAGLTKKPYIEQFAKGGLTNLAWQCASDTRYFYSDNCKYVIQTNGELHKMLGINKNELKRMRKNNYNFEALVWLKYEKERNVNLDDTTLKWFVEHKIKPKDIVFISDRMSEQKICKYIKQQMLILGDKVRDILTTWDDYLIMAKRAKLNITLSMIYAPRNLVEKHNELVEMLGSADSAKLADNVISKFPDIDKICVSIKEKYEHIGKTYSVIVPSRVEDIIFDSNELNHCVAKTPDRYFGRIQSQESYILFLRKSDALEKPFYTLEVEPNGTVRQTRTRFNKQGKDINEIKLFLIDWQKVVSKRLSDEDIEKGTKSNTLRLQEYSDLRANKAIIRNGDYKGKLLADVLEDDLLINRRLLVNA